MPTITHNDTPISIIRSANGALVTAPGFSKRIHALPEATPSAIRRFHNALDNAISAAKAHIDQTLPNQANLHSVVDREIQRFIPERPTER